jgi:hypothetical protein
VAVDVVEETGDTVQGPMIMVMEIVGVIDGDRRTASLLIFELYTRATVRGG